MYISLASPLSKSSSGMWRFLKNLEMLNDTINASFSKILYISLDEITPVVI